MAGKPLTIEANDQDTIPQPAPRRDNRYILVQLGPKLRNLYQDPERTGIFTDVDSRHPHGEEILIVAGRIMMVYKSPGVQKALADSRLEEVYDVEETPIVDIKDIQSTIISPNEAQKQLIEKEIEIALLKAELARFQVEGEFKAVQAEKPKQGK